MEAQEVQLLEKIKSETQSLIEKNISGFITEKQLKDEVAKLDPKADMDKIKSAVDELSLKLSLINERSEKFNEIHESAEDAIKKGIDELVGKKEFTDWVERGCKGDAPSVQVKYSIASGRTGTAMLTTDSGIVANPYSIRPLHVRDLVPVIGTNKPYIVHDTVTSWTNPSLGLGETDSALEMDMTTAEVTTGSKRIAIFMDFSKNALEDISYLKGEVTLQMPDKIKMHEDFQTLFGDGAGNNVDGLFKNATLLNLDGPSFAAGAIASVATYQGGAKSIITFAAEHNLNNGMIITFALFTSSGYNTAFPVNVRTSKSIVIDLAYVADADVSDVTATTKYGLKNAINLATEIDVLNTVKAIMRVKEYFVTAHVMNPQDVAIMEGLKDTSGQYLQGAIERINGVLYVGGIPVIETNFMKQGWGFSGDMRNIARFLEYKTLTIGMYSDVAYEKVNKVCVIAQEQFIFPIFNKFLGTYYNFATVKTALETA